MMNFKKAADNEQGFVLIASLLMLMILMIIGVAATNTTIIELQISGNDKLNKQTFYQAEAVINEAVQIVQNDAADYKENATWLIQNPVTAGVLTTGSGGTETTDVYTDATWTNNTAASTGLPGVSAQMLGVYRGIAHGGSLDLGASRPHLFDIYGRSQRNNARSILKVGCRTHF